MNRFFRAVKRNKAYTIIAVVVLVILAIIVIKKRQPPTEEAVVEVRDIIQSVVLSGTLENRDKADLGFAASGRVGNIFVKNNQSVSQGQILAQLEIGDLLADLKIKQANSKISDLDLEAAKDEVDKVTKQENTKVENSYRTLLSEGLEFTPNSSTYTVDAPTIGGLYNGTVGEYKVIISRESFSSDYIMRTFNLENTEIEIREEGPTALGTKGLYITFPDSVNQYNNTTWHLEIPNKNGDTYLSNYNAYREARNNRDLAIHDAESAYQKLLSANNSGVSSVAQAEIDKIRAEIRKNTIYAPFFGRVTNIEREVGENASMGDRIITILGAEKLQVVLEVSELDVSKLIPGSTVVITLDAFPGEEFEGKLETVNWRETEVDGVPVYEAFVELKSDSRLKTGMSASGMIILAEKKGVLTVPSYLIYKEDGADYVYVLNQEGKTEKREVVRGLLGTDSMVEIISGLKEGEKIVSND